MMKEFCNLSIEKCMHAEYLVCWNNRLYSILYKVFKVYFYIVFFLILHIISQTKSY